jgi:hypothetical protein
LGFQEEKKEQRLEAQLHQKTVSFLLHPKTPVCRMLVVHRTGSGKVDPL